MLVKPRVVVIEVVKSSWILKAGPREFSYQLDMEYEKKGVLQADPNFWRLSMWNFWVKCFNFISKCHTSTKNCK